jgi:hypothetical protein
MPLVSCRFAGETSIANGMPYLSTATLDFGAADLLSAVDTAVKTTRRRATGLP